MGDILIINLVLNIFIFSLIFWILTWISEYFYTIKSQLSKKQFYECGFKSISELNIQVNVNFFMLAVFLILYDIEFTLLFPALFNSTSANLIQVIITIIFIILIVLSLIYDFYKNVLSFNSE